MNSANADRAHHVYQKLPLVNSS